jgi:hypothetical protein
MDDLTATELKVLNNVSRRYNTTVELGTKVQALIDRIPSTGTPVNAVAAELDLVFTSVVIDGETVTVDNPLVAGSDVYEFLADDEQTKTDEDNIAVDITAYAAKAVGTLTLATQPTSGDTITIGTTVYTFVPDGTANSSGEVSVGADAGEAQENLVAAINGTDGFNDAHTLVSAADFALDDMVVTAFIGGTAGNAIATTADLTDGSDDWAGATLASGGNCSAANAATAMTAALTASDTQGVGPTKDGSTVTFTADTAGAAGNDIEVAETLANGAFDGDATELAGGVDATVGTVETCYIDDTYLYVCVANNTVADSNWRRIAVGSAY